MARDGSGAPHEHGRPTSAEASGHGPPPFALEVAVEGARHLLALEGELDVLTVEQLAGRLDEAIDAGADRVVIDLRGLSFIDSSGLRGLLMAAERCRSREVGIAMIRGSDRIHRVFTLMKLETRLPLVGPEELEEASG